MSTVPEIRNRLLGAGTPFSAVLGATELAAVKDDRPAGSLPVAFVLVTRDVSAENQRGTGPVLQRCERDVAVVYVLEDLTDPNGEAAGDALEAVKAWVRGRLVGFVPSDMTEKITHVAGEVVQAVAGCVWFEDTFAAPTYIEETA